MWSLITMVAGWLLGLFKPSDDAQKRKDELDLGAATQRDTDRGSDAKIIRDAERAVKGMDPDAPDKNDLDSSGRR